MGSRARSQGDSGPCSPASLAGDHELQVREGPCLKGMSRRMTAPGVLLCPTRASHRPPPQGPASSGRRGHMGQEGRRGAAGVLRKHWLGCPRAPPAKSTLPLTKGEAEAAGSEHSGQAHTAFLRFTVDPATPAVTMDSRD